MTAGGNRARKTPGANMRFKVLHKFYDFADRFAKDGAHGIACLLYTSMHWNCMIMRMHRSNVWCCGEQVLLIPHRPAAVVWSTNCVRRV